MLKLENLEEQSVLHPLNLPLEATEQSDQTAKPKQIKVAPINYDNAILVIKFDDTNFDYSTALFESISGALEQMPSAGFEVVAVSPSGGSSFADQARDRASEVFSKIVEMGVPTERLSIASSTSSSAPELKKFIFILKINIFNYQLAFHH